MLFRSLPKTKFGFEFSVTQNNKRSNSLMNLQSKVLTLENINQSVKQVKYAVRGPIVQLAVKLQDELNRGIAKPFEKIIRANIGDCHATGQSPITFFRQVLAGCTAPELLKRQDFLPDDVISRCHEILNGCQMSIGCYSDSTGTPIIKQKVADYIKYRDGYDSNADDIFLINGASSGVKMIIYMLINNNSSKRQGIMVPIPQYPLYSASISEFGGDLIPYHLDEDKEWSLDINELEASYYKYCEKGQPRGLVIINPGNPTGQVLIYENIKEIIKFAKSKNLILIADEVYQENIYDDKSKFYSFKKVLNDMGSEYKDFEMVSFHSISKGYYGECGIRGGYMEVVNFSPDVKAQITKLMSAQLGSSMPGQVILSCVVDPPIVGDESFKTYFKEKNYILSELNKKADMVYRKLNKIPGISCNKVQGAMYAFPKLDLSASAIQAAKECGKTPDEFFCEKFLLDKGVCVVPGSGFGQKEGTYHFRMTILPNRSDMNYILESLEDFTNKFNSIYS